MALLLHVNSPDMNAQVPPLCNPPQALTNGDFEDTGTCSTGADCNNYAFNTNGCGVPGWMAGIGSADLCQSFTPTGLPTVTAFSGTWFAKMQVLGGTNEPNCATEGIVQTLNLVTGYNYNLTFHHRTSLLAGTGVDVNIYLVSGFTNFEDYSLGPCPTPDPAGYWSVRFPISAATRGWSLLPRSPLPPLPLPSNCFFTRYPKAPVVCLMWCGILTTFSCHPAFQA